MATQQQFIEFLSEIEPSDSTKSVCGAAHRTLRAKLAEHPTYKAICKETYLSGSYARDTAIRPRVRDGTLRRPDVDVIVVTNHSSNDRPSDVIATLRRAVKQLGYEEVESNRRSICVQLGAVEMDVVPVISDAWQSTGWLIADKNEERWLATNPMGHNDWARAVNKKANSNFKPLVKLVKWWRRENLPHLKRPKGFILETLVANLMDYRENSYEELFAKFLERTVSEYEGVAANEQVPYLADPSVEDNNVFSRVKPEEFKRFYELASDHAQRVRRAQRETDPDKSLMQWQRIFGDRFRKPAPKSGGLLRPAATTSTAMGLTFPSQAVVPPNKPPGFA